MKKIFVLGFVSFMALLMILSGCTNAVGQASETALRRNINANSCNADGMCEMNDAQVKGWLIASKAVFDNYVQVDRGVYINGKVISTVPGSTSALFLTSDVRKIIVPSNLELDDDSTLIVGKGVTIFGKTISTSPGSTSDLILTSDTRAVVIDGTLSVGLGKGVVVHDNGIITTPSGSQNALILTSNMNQVAVQGDLTADTLFVPGAVVNTLRVNLLTGETNAFACLDKNGQIFRSPTPCA